MTVPFKQPDYKATAFNCPHCNAYAEQRWRKVVSSGMPPTPKGLFLDLEVAFCSHCEEYSLWHFGTMVYPSNAGVAPPNSDLNEDIKTDYLEAASILNHSPRGAAALLRLCIQKLCIQLGERGRDANTDIGSLVKKGLPVLIQQALDVVRVIGNDAVHPGFLDIKDDRETANKLFGLINMIAQNRITEPKEIGEMYDQLPQAKRDAIAKRDGKSTP